MVVLVVLAILIVSEWVQNVISVNRINNRLIIIQIIFDKSILNISSIYTSQTGCPLEEYKISSMINLSKEN